VPEKEATPAAGAIPPADTIAQVSGFYRAEDDGGAPYAWTMGEAILRMQAPGDAATLDLRLSAGPRPRALPEARACVNIAAETIPYPQDKREALPWQSLGCHAVSRAGTDLRLPVPALQSGQAYLVRITTEPWRPIDLPPDSGDPPTLDSRRLGLRWLGAQFRAAR